MARGGFTLLGDALWLDFINSDRGRIPVPPDLLPDATAFARWCTVQQLDALGDAAPFPQVLALRARLTEVAEAMHDRRQPPAGAIAALNELLARNAGSQRLTRIGGEWRLGFAPVHPLGALEAITRSAAATLAERRAAVRRCAGETCSLFLLDDSPAGGRRWCDAGVCGRSAYVERRRVSLG